MNDQERIIREFFRKYEEQFYLGLSGKIDVAEAASSFADCYVSANPQGITCGKNDKGFKAEIPKGYAFYRSIGTEKMDVKDIVITPLDELHAVAHVLWSSAYRRKEDQKLVLIDFTVHYFLRIEKGKATIFGFVTGDEQEVFKEHGLLPQD